MGKMESKDVTPVQGMRRLLEGSVYRKGNMERIRGNYLSQYFSRQEKLCCFGDHKLNNLLNNLLGLCKVPLNT